jgi:predicted transcriptional regulator
VRERERERRERERHEGEKVILTEKGFQKLKKYNSYKETQ